MKRILPTAIALISLAAWISPAAATSVDTTTNQIYGPCTWNGISEITGSSYGYSHTNWVGGNCYSNTFHVHAYFWGTDSLYHYREQTAALGATASYMYWTNDIYGYHSYPGVQPYPPSTHAYTY